MSHSNTHVDVSDSHSVNTEHDISQCVLLDSLDIRIIWGGGMCVVVFPVIERIAVSVSDLGDIINKL